jgi:hypothetical protein
MARRLNTYVHVHVDGVSTVYGPGDTIPGPVAKLITTPDVWDEDHDDTPALTETVDVDADSGDDSSAGDTSDDDPDVTSTAMPKKNGSRPAWAAYADANGFEVDPDMKRDDIIAALKTNGIPVD